MSFHQLELLAALSSPIAAGIVKVVDSDRSIVQGIERAFRFEGSRIRWDLARGHISTHEAEHDSIVFHEFFKDRCRELGNGQTAIYLNDDLIECALSASLFVFQRHLNGIISIPAHHYFVAEDFEWCIAYTMEGDIDFGWSAQMNP